MHALSLQFFAGVVYGGVFAFALNAVITVIILLFGEVVA